MAGLFTYDSSDPLPGMQTVRMLLCDTDGSRQTGVRDEWSFLLTDGEINRMLAMSYGDEYQSAGRLCLVMAAMDLVKNHAVRIGMFSTTNDAADKWQKMAELYTHQSELIAVTGIREAPVAYDENSFREFLSYKMLRGESN